MREIEDLRHDIDDLCADMDSFCDIYREDKDVWQGEAATEEVCYITSDIDEFRRTAEKMKRRLDLLTETAGGEER